MPMCTTVALATATPATVRDHPRAGYSRLRAICAWRLQVRRGGGGPVAATTPTSAAPSPAVCTERRCWRGMSRPLSSTIRSSTSKTFSPRWQQEKPGEPIVLSRDPWEARAGGHRPRFARLPRHGPVRGGLPSRLPAARRDLRRDQELTACAWKRFATTCTPPFPSPAIMGSAICPRISLSIHCAPETAPRTSLEPSPPASRHRDAHLEERVAGYRAVGDGSLHPLPGAAAQHPCQRRGPGTAGCLSPPGRLLRSHRGRWRWCRRPAPMQNATEASPSR